MQNAVEKRVVEFSTGRYCARRALEQLGVEPCPILVGHKRQPIWPRGIVGSITHCPGYCAAAVARHEDVCGLGIDVEPHQPLPPGVIYAIASRSEQEHISALPGGVHWGRLLFSAKESLFKAWFPLTGEWLDFLDARIDFNPSDRTVSVDCPLIENLGTVLADYKVIGRYLVRDGFVLTAMSLHLSM